MTDNAFSNLVPDYIRNSPTYVPGKPIEEVARETGLDPAGIVKLASNENPLGMSDAVKAAIVDSLAEGARYPDGHGYALRQALIRKLGVTADQIVLGNGSSDLIAMVAATFLTPATSVVCSQYSFSAYFSSSRVQGATMIPAPARDFGHDPEAMLAAIRPDTRVMFIANPNNPTGTRLETAVLEDLIARVPSDVIVVLDEAYREYQPAAEVPDSIAWVARYPNLIVFRTLSKAYGLAGLRVGFAIASPAVADLVNRVRQTFNVNLFAQAAAVAALDDADYLRRTHDLNLAGLAQLYAGLEALGIAYVPSAANFVMAEVIEGAAVYRGLIARGVIVRPLKPNYDLPRFLRISVGTSQENARLIEALGEVLKEIRLAAPA